MFTKVIFCQPHQQEIMENPDFLCGFILIFEPSAMLYQGNGIVYKRDGELHFETTGWTIKDEVAINKLHMIIRNSVIKKDKLMPFHKAKEQAERIIYNQMSEIEKEMFLLNKYDGERPPHIYLEEEYVTDDCEASLEANDKHEKVNERVNNRWK